MVTDRNDDDQVRSLAHSMVKQFGSRGPEVAERQGALARDDGDIARAWKDIATAPRNDERRPAGGGRPDARQQQTELRMIAGDAGDMTAFLARLLLRSELSPDAQRAILGLRTRVVRTPARRDIVMPGETVDHACLVVSGLLGRFDQVLDGNRQITALYVRGDMCDLHSVVAPTTAWGLTALSATVTLRVPHSALKALVTEHPQIAFALWRDTTADASILAKWVSNLGQKSARARLAHLLCEVGVRLELAGAGDRTSYAFDVSQEQLGSILGLTSIHVNRTLQALRTATIVTAREHRVEVSDWASLAAIAEFSPDFLLLSRNHAAA